MSTTENIITFIKSSGNRSGAISKTLLTPCRRIGLSRKRNTSTFNSPLSQEINAKQIAHNLLRQDPVINETESPTITSFETPEHNDVDKSSCDYSFSSTPVLQGKKRKRMNIMNTSTAHNGRSPLVSNNNTVNTSNASVELPDNFQSTEKFSEKVSQSESCESDTSSIFSKTKKNTLGKKGKSASVPKTDSKDSDVSNQKSCKRVRVILSSDDESENSGDAILQIVKTNSIDNCENKQLNINKLESQTPLKDVQNINLRPKISSEQLLNQNEINKITIDTEKVKDSDNDQCNIKLVNKDHEKTEKNMPIAETETLSTNTVNKNSKKKQIKRKLSMKKSTSSCNSDLMDSDDDFRPINLDDQEECVNSKDNNKTGIDVIDDSYDKEFIIKKCRVVLKRNFQDNDGDQVVESLKTDKILSNQVINNILQIERRIKDKDMRLSKLQQAQLYHQIHNLEQLSKITNVWKEGCEQALNDLLVKLKEHATIDMPMLLQNLKVPTDLISFNVDEDSFI